MEQQRKYLIAGAGTLIAVLGGLWWLTPSSTLTSVPTVAEANGSGPKRPGVIVLDDRAMARLGMRLATAQLADTVPLASVPAIVVPPANARVAVAATLPGVITRTYVIEGQSVGRGQLLATVSSREVLTLGADLARSNARLGVASSSAGRLGQLAREGVIAGARHDEAAATLREAQVDASEKRRILALSNASGANGTYSLVAPIAGRVTTATAQAGSPVDGSTAPFVIDAADRYEIEAQIPERLAGALRPGMRVEIGPNLGGTVTAIGSTIDPATRSVMLKASIGASPGIVTGKATTATVFGPGPANAVTVPSSAIVNLNGADVVFVQVRGGVIARKVRVGGTASSLAVILDGLRPGEKVVATGTSELKSLALAQ